MATWRERLLGAHNLLGAYSDVLGMNRRNLDLVLAKNPRKHFVLANDKLLTKQVLSEIGAPVTPTLRTFDTFYSLSELQGWLREQGDVVFKPSRGSGGRGILVVAGRDGEDVLTPSGRRLRPDEVRRHVADIVYGVYTFDRADVALVEPRLIPHAFFADLFADGLSDIRIMVVDGKPAAGMIRVPTRESDGKANLHQGGLGLGLRLEDGHVHRAWHRGQTIEHHPDTGSRLLGQCVPFWDEIMGICLKVSAALPLGFLGLDIVVDRDRGPTVLEINVRPGLEIQNVTGVPLRRRLAELGIS